MSQSTAGSRIWLIARDWTLRALVRAQLLEEGHEVTAVEDWEALADLIQDDVMAPALIIAELAGDEPPHVVALLRSLPVRRLVIRGSGAPSVEALRSAGVDAVLSRPCTVGEVILAARALLGERHWNGAKRTGMRRK